mgnify:CR=1 FL=1
MMSFPVLTTYLVAGGGLINLADYDCVVLFVLRHEWVVTITVWWLLLSEN